ncbi:MAG: redoxin domain-containing protein [Chloroflexi bacterium]|nr:redoxin domain-containing protein [Chloroflexota bacterium]
MFDKSTKMRLLTVLPLVAMLLAGCLPSAIWRALAKAPAPTATPSPVALETATPPETATPRPTATQTRPAAPSVPKVGQEAYDLTLNNLDGEAVTLSDLRGKKVILIFWASWCGACQLEIAHLVEVYDEYHEDGLEIVAINLLEPPERVEEAVKAWNMSFTVLLDEQGEAARAYYVRPIPMSVFIDEEGIIQNIRIGVSSEEALRDQIEALME